MKQQHGFSLIELIIFIVVVSILVAGILIGFNQVLSGSTAPEENSIAFQLAKQRMELILGQRDTLGFTPFVDPCVASPGLPICTLPAGYAITQPTVTVAPNPNFKNIIVSVTGPGFATLTSRVANYAG